MKRNVMPESQNENPPIRVPSKDYLAGLFEKNRSISPEALEDHLQKIVQILSHKESRLEDEAFGKFRNSIASLLDSGIACQNIKQVDGKVHFGERSDLNDSQIQAMQTCLENFIPWKKGPFNFFGIDIDAEWRSDLKWSRLLGHFKNLKGKVVADIGCNNAYFMYRMLEQDPELVMGFEPYAKHLLSFQMMQSICYQERLKFELLGVEDIDLFPRCFDTIFCLGILYHHTDPVGLLRKMHSALQKGGEIIIDCQGIEGSEAVAFVPSQRYAGAKGIWFLPTAACLINWVKRAGFQKEEVFFNEYLDSEEQRSSRWAPIQSLADFLDPQEARKTIEGHPAPKRIYLRAQK